MGYAHRSKGTDTGTATMAEHKHGDMDISAQQKTFDGFMTMTKNATIAIIVLLVFLAFVAI